MSKRVMGKASFAHPGCDNEGDIQIYVRRDDVGEEAYADFKKLDIGDIIGVKGNLFRTKMGEISVHATEVTLLSKSLLPLPEKFHGLQRHRASLPPEVCGSHHEPRGAPHVRGALKVHQVRSSYLDGMAIWKWRRPC